MPAVPEPATTGSFSGKSTQYLKLFETNVFIILLQAFKNLSVGRAYNYDQLHVTLKAFIQAPICPLRNLKEPATGTVKWILWGNNKSQVWGPNSDNSPLEEKNLSPVLDFLILPEQFSPSSKMWIPSQAQQVVGTSNCPQAEAEGKKQEETNGMETSSWGWHHRWFSQVSLNFMAYNWWSFWQNYRLIIFRVASVVPVIVMSRLEYDSSYSKGQVSLTGNLPRQAPLSLPTPLSPLSIFEHK